MESNSKSAELSCANTSEHQSLKFHNFQSNSDMSNLWREKCEISEAFDIVDSKMSPEQFPVNDSKQYITSTSSSTSNSELLESDFAAMKLTVDENERLTKRLNELQKQKTQTLRKIMQYNNRIKKKQIEIMKTKGIWSSVMGTRRTAKIEPNLIHKVFSQGQINFLLGKKKVVWSYDDMAMAFTLRHIANKECYLYLKNTLNMPLPSLSSVQKWVAADKS